MPLVPKDSKTGIARDEPSENRLHGLEGATLHGSRSHGAYKLGPEGQAGHHDAGQVYGHGVSEFIDRFFIWDQNQSHELIPKSKECVINMPTVAGQNRCKNRPYGRG